jgi:hypothetical protein
VTAAANDTTPPAQVVDAGGDAGASAAELTVRERVALLDVTATEMDRRIRHLTTKLEATTLDLEAIRAELGGLAHDVASLRTVTNIVNDELDRLAPLPAAAGKVKR